MLFLVITFYNLMNTLTYFCRVILLVLSQILNFKNNTDKHTNSWVRNFYQWGAHSHAPCCHFFLLGWGGGQAGPEVHGLVAWSPDPGSHSIPQPLGSTAVGIQKTPSLPVPLLGFDFRPLPALPSALPTQLTPQAQLILYLQQREGEAHALWHSRKSHIPPFPSVPCI